MREACTINTGCYEGSTVLDILTPGVTTTRKDALHRPTHKSNAIKKESLLICEKLAQLTPGVMKGTTVLDILTPGGITTREDALHTLHTATQKSDTVSNPKVWSH